jgi:hypothetical protein
MKKRVTILILASFSMVLPQFMWSQSASIIDEILSEPQLTYGSAAYIVLGATGLVAEDVSRSAAVAHLEAHGAGRSGTAITAPLSLGEYSLIVMQVLDVEGGLVYTLSNEARYAVRELEFLGAIQGRAFPGMTIDGARGLRILNRTLKLREEGRL